MFDVEEIQNSGIMKLTVFETILFQEFTTLAEEALRAEEIALTIAIPFCQDEIRLGKLGIVTKNKMWIWNDKVLALDKEHIYKMFKEAAICKLCREHKVNIPNDIYPSENAAYVFRNFIRMQASKQSQENECDE